MDNRNKEGFMAASRVPGPEKGSLYAGVAPARTPGPLGLNDASDPDSTTMFGDTEGPVGIKDGALTSALIAVSQPTTYLQKTSSTKSLQGGGTGQQSSEPAQAASLVDTVSSLVTEPRVRAMLDVIAFSEGTAGGASGGYGVIVRGKVISAPFNPDLVGKTNVSITDFSRHPQILVQVAPGLQSTAAGRYQFLYSTWKGLGLPDFSPASQDMAAVMRLKSRGAIEPLLAGDFASAVSKASWEWASFPGSPYGQPTKTLGQLEQVYQSALPASK